MRNCALAILFVLCLPLIAARYTINGYVSSNQSGERLIGATVIDTVSGYGAVTNNSGFYSLTLQAGQVCLSVSYVGYSRSDYLNFTLSCDTFLNISLIDNTHLEEVTVVGRQSISGPQSVQMSTIDVPIQQIKGIPALGGEVDVLKAIQLLPGVQSGTEGSAGLYVRGGGQDENLVLLDGVPLYNVNHAMGFFSVFNADAIKNVTLYKGNFPARFGSRLSSVLDVRQNDGNDKAYHGNLTVGLIAAKVNAEGPIIKGKTTFNVSARRTYFDLFTTPIMAIILKNESDGNDSGAAGYYFYDVNAKVTHTFSDNDKLSASFYMGDDKVYVRYREQSANTGNMRLRIGYNWGNLLGAVNWEHRFNSRIFCNTQLSFTRYRYKLQQSLNETEEVKSVQEIVNQQMNYNSYIMDLMLQTNFEYTPSPKHELRWGAAYTWHNFRPEVFSMSINSNVDDQIVMDTTLSGSKVMSHEAYVYVEDTYTPWRWLRLNIGLHGSLYGLSGKVYPSIEPRVGVRALIINDLAFKASYAYISQYVHLLSNSSISLPTDLWVPVTKRIEPMRCMQVAAGLSYNVLNHVELSVEGYYKKMLNLMEYKDGSSFMLSTQGWEDKVVLGDGWSYGVEFMAQRTIGKLTGWVAYTWSRTMRQFNREGQEINFGKPFHAKFDREHDLSITLQYQVTKRIELSSTFVYATGNRATLATQIYYDPTRVGNINRINMVTQRNNYKLPDYHRLDIGANFHFPSKKHSWAEHLLNVSVYNVYNNMNPFLVFPDSDRGKLYKITIFPILPSLSYTFKW